MITKFLRKNKLILEDFATNKIDVNSFEEKFKEIFYEKTEEAIPPAEFKIVDGIFWDLEFFEPDPEKRAKDAVLIDEDKLRDSVKDALDRIKEIEKRKGDTSKDEK